MHNENVSQFFSVYDCCPISFLHDRCLTELSRPSLLQSIWNDRSKEGWFAWTVGQNGWYTINRPGNHHALNLTGFSEPLVYPRKIESVEALLLQATKQSVPLVFNGLTVHDLMVIGEYESAEAFFPSKTFNRCGILKVSKSGYVDFNGKVVSVDTSLVCSHFIVLAKIQDSRDH